MCLFCDDSVLVHWRLSVLVVVLGIQCAIVSHWLGRSLRNDLYFVTYFNSAEFSKHLLRHSTQSRSAVNTSR